MAGTTYYTCMICNTVHFQARFSTHLSQEHGLGVKDYYMSHILKVTQHPKCENPECEKDVIFLGIKQGFRKFCSVKCRANHPDHIKMTSEKILKYYSDCNSNAEMAEERRKRNSEIGSRAFTKMHEQTYESEESMKAVRIARSKAVRQSSMRTDPAVRDHPRYLYLIQLNKECFKIGTTHDQNRIEDFYQCVDDSLLFPRSVILWSDRIGQANMVESYLLDNTDLFFKGYSYDSILKGHGGVGELRHMLDFDKCVDYATRMMGH